jgi:hypothetical protein
VIELQRRRTFLGYFPIKRASHNSIGVEIVSTCVHPLLQAATFSPAWGDACRLAAGVRVRPCVLNHAACTREWHRVAPCICERLSYCDAREPRGFLLRPPIHKYDPRVLGDGSCRRGERRRRACCIALAYVCRTPMCVQWCTQLHIRTTGASRGIARKAEHRHYRSPSLDLEAFSSFKSIDVHDIAYATARGCDAREPVRA